MSFERRLEEQRRALAAEEEKKTKAELKEKSNKDFEKKFANYVLHRAMDLLRSDKRFDIISTLINDPGLDQAFQQIWEKWSPKQSNRNESPRFLRKPVITYDKVVMPITLRRSLPKVASISPHNLRYSLGFARNLDNQNTGITSEQLNVFVENSVQEGNELWGTHGGYLEMTSSGEQFNSYPEDVYGIKINVFFREARLVIKVSHLGGSSIEFNNRNDLIDYLAKQIVNDNGELDKQINTYDY